ncbi:translation initiation factor 2 (bIF-2) [Marinilabilia salmonicolor]|jgi:translation initiation factor IF-2|uniref:translation initiation factor IF-2 n=1 Tax=Marinilabilia salmonicolor TaxID=989 RepID=UPI000D07944B|nr:translation initiation factor IF-2 [Marinilabilia salmonicolor]PRY99806.1 translation initiation factor 2 (bIF-2) [Marinilabilia salmonicolor]
MAVGKRLSKIAKECNVGISTIVDFLHKKGFQIESNPNTKISEDMVDLLRQEYRSDFTVKQESEKLVERKQKGKKSSVSIDDLKEEQDVDEDTDVEDEVPPVVKPEKKKEEKPTAEFSTPKQKMDVKVVGKIDLDQKKKAEEQQKEEQKKVEETAAVESKETAKAADKPEKSSQEEKKTEDKEPEVGHSKKDESEKETPDQKVDIPVEVEKPDKDLKVVGKIDLEKKPEETDQKEVKAEDVSEKKEKGASKETKKEVKPEKEQAAPVEKKSAEQKPAEEKPAEEKAAPETAPAAEKEDSTKKDADSFMPTKVKKLSGPTVVGKIDLPANARNNESRDEQRKKKKKRKRIRKEKERVNIADKQQPQNANGAGKVAPQDKKEKRKKTKAKKRPARPEVSEEDVQKQIKETLARLTSKGKSKTSRHRRDKRDAAAQKEQDEMDRMTEESKVLKVTEFLTANDLASMMDVQVTQIISTCMSLGLFVSINQRLDAETITLVAEEYGYSVEFISVDAAEAIEEKEDNPEDLKPRPPIITVMGHVDHGKTSLLDHIRKENVIAGEAGGITQHIGAYNVELADGREITFLDTPGHEAFTAMRARGAQVTDIAIIIVAADDDVMPQTIEAINHASAAGVPIVFAINKIDKPNANPDRVKEELANMNYLVEEWGGKYQSQDISAKNGVNIDQLLEKVLLEADLLELKANPDKPAVGSVIESTLDRGRGYVATLLVQSGTLKTGDLLLSGQYYGHVKAMYNERNQNIDKAGPAEPVLVLGLNGAPQAGEKFHVMENEKEAKDIATKRSQLQREQGLRTQKHITLDEIGRRIAIGNFQELNLVVKGDVDGSIEALADSLIKLSTEEIQVNVIHKAVGQISESDIMLAAASNAIVIGFQVRPSLAARRIAEKEEIDIRLYSIIYDAIEEITAAMEGMLSPEIKEQITATVEIRDVFKITKVGTIAGCMVKEGKVKRSSKVRVIRDGIVIYTGELGSLKRFKDDAKEVASGYECGLNIKNFNDIKIGDIIEAFEEVEVSRTL